MKGDDYMATRDTYEVQEWEDLPSETTPISGERLRHIENGIKNAADDSALKSVYDDDHIELGTGNTVYNEESYSILNGKQNVLQNGFGTLMSGNNNYGSGSNHGCFGYGNRIGGSNNFLSGANNTAEEENGSGLGIGLKVKSMQHVTGRYNTDDVDHKYAEMVGNGESDTQRSNAYTLDWQGNAKYAGTVESKGIILTDSATEQKYKLTIANGNIEITAVE